MELEFFKDDDICSISLNSTSKLILHKVRSLLMILGMIFHFSRNFDLEPYSTKGTFGPQNANIFWNCNKVLLNILHRWCNFWKGITCNPNLKADFEWENNIVFFIKRRSLLCHIFSYSLSQQLSLNLYILITTWLISMEKTI